MKICSRCSFLSKGQTGMCGTCGGVKLVNVMWDERSMQQVLCDKFNANQVLGRQLRSFRKEVGQLMNRFSNAIAGRLASSGVPNNFIAGSLLSQDHLLLQSPSYAGTLRMPQLLDELLNNCEVEQELPLVVADDTEFSASQGVLAFRSRSVSATSEQMLTMPAHDLPVSFLNPIKHSRVPVAAQSLKPVKLPNLTHHAEEKSAKEVEALRNELEEAKKWFQNFGREGSIVALSAVKNTELVEEEKNAHAFQRHAA